MISQSFIIELSLGDKTTNSILSLGVVTGARQLLLGEDAPTNDNWTFIYNTGHSLADKTTNSILSVRGCKVARQSLLDNDQPIIYKTVELLLGDSILSLGVVTGARQLLLGEDAPTNYNWTFIS
jgi:hypothetical protein